MVDQIYSIDRIDNFIGGEFQPPVSGNYLDNYEPATGKVYNQLADSDTRDIGAAVLAASAAQRSWFELGIRKRSAILIRMAELIERDLDRLAVAESIDNGKPVLLSREVDIPRAANNFRFFGTAIDHFSTEAHISEQAINYTSRDPLGVVGCISPWNLPLYLFSWKVAPALAVGNAVVGKPSELAPLTAYLLAQIGQEAGLPPGVLNIVQGLGAKAGQSIVEHPDVKAVSFTGGTQTGRRIAMAAAPSFTKLSLELGGKNPNLVFSDCDFELAVNTSIQSSFSNQGEICLCGSRIFIEESIYSRFKQAFVKRAGELCVGDPLDGATQMGALISAEHLRKVEGFVDLARQEGGSLVSGGHGVKVNGRCASGYFMAPTVLEGLDPHCRTNQEEIFGPVVTLIPFHAEEDAIEWANGTPYGLSATLWTSDLNRAHRVAGKLDCGVVWINCWMLRDLRTPFGGTKQSGVGREGGWEAIRFFTDAKNICVGK